MQHLSRALVAVCPVIASLGLLPGSALADISGLTSGTYSYNQADAGSPAVIGPGSIQLTTGSSQARSIWFNTRQDITHFTATFVYQEQLFSSNPTGTSAGLDFVISNSPAGPSALGNAVTNGYGAISPSAAVVLDTFSGNSSLGFYRNGVLTSADVPVSPIDFTVRRNINVTVGYDGSLLSITMTDGALTFGPQTYLVGSLASSLGSSSAYVGFTAGDGDVSTYQILSGFTYTTVPTPMTASLLGMAGLTALGRRRR